MVVALPEVDVGCWDTGGDGPPVVLMHAAWGSAELWAPQLTSLAGAGFRAIAWSRRGHRGSGVGPVERPGTMVDDLHALAEALQLDRFHLVGTALGGFGSMSFALARPERLLSLTIAASLCGITDPDFVAETSRLVPPALDQLPVELRELSAAYRYRSPDGVREWTRLTDRAVHDRVHQPSGAEVTRAGLEELRTPALLIAGDADIYMPPKRMAEVARSIPRARFVTVTGAGHSPAWENAAQFDRHVLAFLAGTSTATPNVDRDRGRCN